MSSKKPNNKNNKTNKTTNKTNKPTNKKNAPSEVVIKSKRSTVLPTAFRFPGSTSPFPFYVPTDVWQLVLNTSGTKLSDFFGLATSSKWGYNCFWDSITHLHFANDASATRIQHMLCRCSISNLKGLSIARISVPFARFEKLELQCFTRLESLELRRMKHFEAEFLENLVDFVKLRRLVVGCPTLSPGIRSISKLTKLQSLSLSGLFKVEELDCGGLGHLEELSVFCGGDDIPHAKMVGFVGGLRGLRVLEIRGSRIVNSSLEAIASNVIHLETLKCSPQDLSLRGIESLQKLTRLRELHLLGHNVVPPSVKNEISRLTTLEILDYSACATPVKELPPKLERYDMEWHSINLQQWDSFVGSLGERAILLGVSGNGALLFEKEKEQSIFDWLVIEGRALSRKREDEDF